MLAPLLSSLAEQRSSDKTDGGGYPAWLAMTNAREGLTNMKTAYPAINEQLIHTYLSWLVGSGFLPSPQ